MRLHLNAGNRSMTRRDYRSMTQTFGPLRPGKTHADNPLVPIWVAWIGFASAVAAAIIAKINFSKPPKNNSSKLLEGLEKMAYLDDMLAEFSKAGADRALIFEGKNGGAMPRQGKPWRVSLLQYWVAQGVDDSSFSSYNSLNVDGAYRKMLIGAMKSERKIYDFKAGAEGECQLRRYYELEGVTNSIIVILGELGDALIFLSAARHEGEFSHEEVTRIEMLSHKIRREICPAGG